MLLKIHVGESPLLPDVPSLVSVTVFLKTPADLIPRFGIVDLVLGLGAQSNLVLTS